MHIPKHFGKQQVMYICKDSKCLYFVFIELSKRMLSNVFQYETLQKLDLSNNSLVEVENLLQVILLYLLKI